MTDVTGFSIDVIMFEGEKAATNRKKKFAVLRLRGSPWRRHSRDSEATDGI